MNNIVRNLVGMRSNSLFLTKSQFRLGKLIVMNGKSDGFLASRGRGERALAGSVAHQKLERLNYVLRSDVRLTQNAIEEKCL